MSNRQLVDKCDLLIGIFRARLGTPTPEADSGTAEEIDQARSTGKRCIVYFSDESDEEDSLFEQEQPEYKRLREYRQNLNTEGLTDSYKNTQEFQEKVARHLTKAIHEIAKEDRERRAAENEAKETEQALGITLPSSHQDYDYPQQISFDTLHDARASMKLLIESRFGTQDMEDIKEEEIAKIQSALASPDLAELFSRQATAENIAAIAQIIETATTPSMYALSAIARYADPSPEWLDIAGDWIERFSTRKLESGYYDWVSYIKTYPGLLSLYALGISALRATKLDFLQEVVSRSVHSREYDREKHLLDAIDPRYVFYRIGGMIEPGFEKRFTPVSDHLSPLFKDKLYPKEEEAIYLGWFDFFEFLLSFKSVQQGKNHPYFGSFTWRWETNRFIIKMIQDTAVERGRYGEAVSNFLKGQASLEETAKKYDQMITDESQRGFGRAGVINYTTHLIQLAKQGQRVSSSQELMKIIQSQG